MTDMTLAAKLDRLFRTVRPAGRGEYTYEEVASAIRERGVGISHTYIWQLRKGARDNPTKRHLEALAEFFGVEAAQRIDGQLELLAALRDNAVRTVALRAAGLSEPSLEAIRGMIEHARRIEGLPPADPPPSTT